MRRESTEIKFFLENLISGWKQNDETEFFPQNLVPFYHNSAGCAVRALQIVLFELNHACRNRVFSSKLGFFLAHFCRIKRVDNE